jgi:hypothetical protein
VFKVIDTTSLVNGTFPRFTTVARRHARGGTSAHARSILQQADMIGDQHADQHRQYDQQIL